MKHVPLRRLVASLDNGAWGEEALGEADVRCVRAADFDFDRLRVSPRRLPLRHVEPPLARRLELLAGDLVVEKSGGGDQLPVGRAVLFDLNERAIPTNFAARLRPVPTVDSRFLTYALAAHFWAGATARCIKQTTGIQNLDTDAWLNTATPYPSPEEQRRIADFLDDQVSRLDSATLARERQVVSLLTRSDMLVLRAIRGELEVVQELGEVAIPWMHHTHAHWPVLTTGSQFEIELGKMLNEERTTGEHLRPYLRNTNVQWDAINVDDLKEMNFPPWERARYRLQQGDLLICEGGQPGRAAIWNSTQEMYYQKALHRARSRGRSLARWLYYCLRGAVACDAFADEAQTTIAHLTGEQLRATKFPFPEPSVQERLVSRLDRDSAQSLRLQSALARSIDLLHERKRALITAAVTGELDVATASGRGVA